MLHICVREQEGPTSFFVFADAVRQILPTSPPAVCFLSWGRTSSPLCFIQGVQGGLDHFLLSCNYFSRAEIVQHVWEFQNRTPLDSHLLGKSLHGKHPLPRGYIRIPWRGVKMSHKAVTGLECGGLAGCLHDS